MNGTRTVNLVGDVAFLAGVVVLAGGVWMIYPPAAVILAGVVILGLGARAGIR